MSRCWLLLILIISLTSRHTAAQTEFRMPSAEWKITLPKGWESISDEDLVKVNAEVRRAIEDSSLDIVTSQFAAGFRPVVDNGSYILVELKPALPANCHFDDVLSALVKKQQSANMQVAMRKLEMDPIAKVYGDAPNSRVICRAQSLSSDSEALNCISHTNLGTASTVILHAYGPKNDFEQNHEPLLSSILNSFAFDSGNVYAFSTPAKKRDPISEQVGRFIGRALGGLVWCILAVLLFRWIIRRISFR